MNEKSDVLSKSLVCLQQPLTLASIAILLVNDHVLKMSYPSWLTGKISDFAGLFFFPFLVTAFGGIVLRKSRFNSREMGGIAFGLVGIGFLLLKISPHFNMLIAKMAGDLLGHSTYYVLDPTDLMALLVFLPAWRMWNTTPEKHPQRIAWIVLLLAALVTIATSPTPPEIMRAVDFVYYEGSLFVADSDQNPQFIAKSLDGGKEWETLIEDINDKQINDQVIKKVKSLVFPLVYPIVVCDPNDQKICYRIMQTDKVEISTDAGMNWEVAWQLPQERLFYLQRKSGGAIKLKTYDLTIFTQTDKSIILVTLGDEGILRKELPDGAWERIGVGYATPTPYQERDFSNALFFVKDEHVYWLGFALLYFAITMNWHRIKDNKGKAGSDLTYLFSIVYPLAFLASTYAITRVLSNSGILEMVDYIKSLYFLPVYLCFFAQSVASVRTDKGSLLQGILLPVVIYLLLDVGTIFLMLVTQSLVGGLLSALICMVILWFLLKENTKFITEYNLSEVFAIHLVIAIFIASGSFFLASWAYGSIHRYESAMLYAVLHTLFFTLVGIVISRFFRRKEGIDHQEG